MADYKMKLRWSSKQTAFMTEHYEKLTDEQISELLGRTLKSVRRKRERMLLKKKMGRWSEDSKISYESPAEKPKEA